MKERIPTKTLPAVPMRKSIRARAITQAVLLIACTALTLSASAYLTSRLLLRQRILSQISSIANAKEDAISSRILADRERTALLAKQSDVQSILSDADGTKTLTTLLETMQSEGVPALGISVFNGNGQATAHAGLPMKEWMPVTATTLVPSRDKEGWDGYVVYAPTRNAGVLAISYSLREFLSSIFSVPFLGTSGEVLIAKEENGELILMNNLYAPGKRSPLSLGSSATQSKEALPIALAVGANEGAGPAINYDGRSVFAAYRYIPALGWGLAVNTDQVEAMQGMQSMAIALVTKSLLLILLAAYATLLLTRKLTDPLITLTDNMRLLGPGNWKLRRTATNGDEVEVLEKIAADMAVRLKNIYAHLEDEIEKRTEELRDQYLKDRTILESVESAVIMIDEHGVITNANPAASLLLQCKDGDCSFKKYEDVLDIRLHQKRLIGVKHPVYRALKKHSETRSSPDLHYCVMRKDNILIPVWMVVKPLIQDGKPIGVIIVMQDITEERRVDYLKSEFISLASHQLRTPLSSLQWYIELLADEKTLDAEQREYVDEMQIAAKRMSSLIDALLHAARLEGGDITPQRDSVELTTLITELTEELRVMAKDRNISLSIRLPKKKIYMLTDSVLLHVVFKNLFSNAVKYTQKGGTIDVTMVEKGKHVTIAVSDTGIGIPKKDLKRLFQRLFRADNVRKLDTDGNGLGLYISKMIIGNLDGDIVVESTEDKGSTFTVMLPLKPKKG